MQKEQTSVCELCGNEVDSRATRCPFCGAKRTLPNKKSEIPQYRIVNLEKGLPIVRDALKRMQNELETSKLHGYRVLVLIHGYGSSGKGGAIRKGVRDRLQYLLDRNEINDFLQGEDCEKRSGRFRQAMRRFPFLGRVIRKPNPGITLVIL